MTKKLTKNDSVKKCDSDLKRFFVQNQEQLQELREQFEAILYEHDVWYDYFSWWARARKLEGIDNVFTKWKEWTAYIYPEYWLSQAFLYESTDREIALWALCSDLWNVWLYKNIKN